MLDLTIAMLKKKLIVLIFLSLMLMGFSPMSQSGQVAISDPTNGEIIKGVVEVFGSAAGEKFTDYDLAYAYTTAETVTWFPISSNNQEVNSGKLGSWDTSTITDGDYSLKLTVHFSGLPDQEVIVQPLHVRNYTLAETSTLAPEIPVERTTLPTIMITQVNPEKQQNPAVMTESEYRNAITYGLMSGLVIILFLILYNIIRRWMRR